MRVLIIGDYPGFNGGVTNYTRPLAKALSEKAEVFYLYTCTRTENYDLFRTRIVRRSLLLDSTVKYYELVNPPSRYFNYDNPSYDSSAWMNRLFQNFLKKIKPDVVHIHEIFGMSSNLISIAKSLNIKVFVTVHEYWWLCPKRVMVDYNKRVCRGPESISKCAHCIKQEKHVRHSRLRIFLRKRIKWLHVIYMSYLKRKPSLVAEFSLTFGNLEYQECRGSRLFNSLANRLQQNISHLNESSAILGVSQDVRTTLIKFGVNPEKIIVNHIGSVIASNKIPHKKVVNHDQIVFGFIGGVTYYKGVHQIVSAYLQLPLDLKEKAMILIFGKYDESYYSAIMTQVNSDSWARRNIKFMGAYDFKHLPSITNCIDISILPSLCADTAPQTIFESFNAGLPVIAPDLGGFPDFVSDNVTGLIYKGTSVNDLKNKMELVIKSPDVIDLFRKHIVSGKTMTENVQELLKFYKNV